MNILSVLSFTNFILFSICFLFVAEQIQKSRMAISVMLIFVSLGIWCFSMSFFYMEPTKDGAFFWYRISSLGWLTVPVLVLIFVMELTNTLHNRYGIGKLILLGILPNLLLLQEFLFGNHILAGDLLQSHTGLGWSVVNRKSNFWFWMYLFYLFSYLTSSMVILQRWRQKSAYSTQKKHATILIFLISTILFVGITTDIISMFWKNWLPPVTNLSMIIIIFASSFAIKKYRLFDDPEKVTFRTIVNTIAEGVMVFDSELKFVKINPAITSNLGYTMEELANRELKELIYGGKYNEDNVRELFQAKKVKDREIVFVRKDGEHVYGIYSAALAENKGGEFLGYILSYKDITRRKAVEQELMESNDQYRRLIGELNYAANYDSLTGLPNRRLFFIHLKERITALKDGEDLAILYMDLNGFKIINDTYGHDMGDLILKQTAKMLQKYQQPEEELVRMGGDEFVWIIPGGESVSLNQKVQRIKEAFLQPLYIQGEAQKVGIAAGIAWLSEADWDEDHLLSLADHRMYEDKKADKNNPGEVEG